MSDSGASVLQTLLVTMATGVEKITAREIQDLGLEILETGNGYIRLEAPLETLIVLNKGLRTADRVFLELAAFPARDFDEAFEAVRKLPWPEYLPPRANIRVLTRIRKSRIRSERSLQGLVKKAVIKTLLSGGKGKQQETWDESGPAVTIHAEITKDRMHILLDSSGTGLHKRGYRKEAGIAPLQETAAAALLYAAGWDKLIRQQKDRAFWDPFCGAGTIAIEAAMMAAAIPPGSKRSFAFEHWPFISRETKAKAQTMLEALFQPPAKKLPVYGSDIDEKLIAIARENAGRAGLGIDWRVADARESDPPVERGLLICNPPYGQRLGDPEEIAKLYKAWGNRIKSYSGWDLLVYTALPQPDRILGIPYKKNRKLYNGKLKSYLYWLAPE